MSKNFSRSFSCSRSHKIYIRSNKIKLGSTYAYHTLWPLCYDLDKIQDRDKSANRCNGGIGTAQWQQFLLTLSTRWYGTDTLWLSPKTTFFDHVIIALAWCNTFSYNTSWNNNYATSEKSIIMKHCQEFTLLLSLFQNTSLHMYFYSLGKRLQRWCVDDATDVNVHGCRVSRGCGGTRHAGDLREVVVWHRRRHRRRRRHGHVTWLWWAAGRGRGGPCGTEGRHLSQVPLGA